MHTLALFLTVTIGASATPVSDQTCHRMPAEVYNEISEIIDEATEISLYYNSPSGAFHHSGEADYELYVSIRGAELISNRPGSFHGLEIRRDSHLYDCEFPVQAKLEIVTDRARHEINIFAFGLCIEYRGETYLSADRFLQLYMPLLPPRLAELEDMARIPHELLPECSN